MAESAVFPPPDVAALDALFQKQKKNIAALNRTTASERIEKLQRLEAVILKNREAICEAMHLDFRKGKFEVELTEIATTTSEIRFNIENLRSWMTPRSVPTNLPLLGTRSEVQAEAKGNALIMSPWNFPFNLTLIPLISAIAAGCAVIVKPSEFTPNSAACMKKMLAEIFSEDEIAVVEGDVPITTELLKKPFNHIFFTGSPMVGKIVMKAAAENLASVTLELGGKSPVIVDETADLPDAVGKIAWLKCMNAGQICIEPDYLLLHESRLDEFVQLFSAQIEKSYGSTLETRQSSPDFARIVNAKNYNRIKSLIDDAVAQGGRVAFGGHFDDSERFIEPTVVLGAPRTARIFQEEIFGPVLPIFTYKNLEEVVEFIDALPRPLAQYIFSKKRGVIEHILQETTAGGVTVNDCGLHFFNPNLPFGGINNSGIGKSHGLYGFLAFSNEKAVIRQNTVFSPFKWLHPPYGKFARRVADWLIRWI